MSSDISKYLQAGRVASKVRDRASELVHEGLPILELCDRIEGEIRKSGGKPAFPCNVGINQVTAHYTSPIDDLSTITKRSLVKIDLGVHVDGYIADTAFSVTFDGAYAGYIEAASAALSRACDNMKPGTRASKIGGIIQKEIEGRGLKPIWNLNGHKLARFMIHAGKSIPNVSSMNGTKIEAGEVYAIEPFVTSKDAAGEVKDSPSTHIYRYLRDVAAADGDARRLLDYIKFEYRTLPFALRWLKDVLPQDSLQGAVSTLISLKAIIGYPVLVEASGHAVAQVEHTVAVTEEGSIVTTS